MKISRRWLGDHIHTNVDTHTLSETLTDIGLEVEKIKTIGPVSDLGSFVVGQVTSCEKHPNADRLKLTSIDIGDEALQIICGAPNVKSGMKVAVAKIGTKIKPTDAKEFTIKKSKIRNVYSFGMLCSEVELGIGEDSSGILELKESLANGTPLSEVFQIETDEQIEIGLTPNRNDAMSHMGVARDLKAAFEKRNIKSEFKTRESKVDLFSQMELPHVTIESKEAVVRYMGVFLDNVTVKESPDWLKEKLKSIDLRPINNVVDVTNFIIHDLGQPLHAFDGNQIKDRQIRVRFANSGEDFKTLDEKDLKLDNEDLLIGDSSNGMCLAGVIGGLDSGVSESTKSIFLEAAVFDPILVRKTAKRYNLFSDSSFRFERGVDPNFTATALALAIELLQEVTGATIISNTFDYYPKKIDRKQIDLDLTQVHRLIGLEIPKTEILEILENLEFEVIEQESNHLKISIPTYRMDVTRPADVIEEILRIYGFNAVPVSQRLNTSITKTEKEDISYKRKKHISKQLISFGFCEAMNVSLDSEDLQKYSDKKVAQEAVEIFNPLSKELSIMRTSLMPSLLKNVAYNQKRQQIRVALFEFGKSYGNSSQESEWLSLVLSGSQTNYQTNKSSSDVFFELKGTLEAILNGLGVDFSQQSHQDSLKGKGVSLKKSNIHFASIYQLSDDTQKAFDLNSETAYAAINWEVLEEIINGKEVQLEAISSYPSVKRDLSLLLDKSISYEDLKRIAFEACPKLLKEVLLFDVYEGDKVGENKKSYALSFTLQKQEATLTDKEVEATMDEILAIYKKKLGAVLR